MDSPLLQFERYCRPLGAKYRPAREPTQNSDNLRSFEYLCKSTRSHNEALHQGFVMGLKRTHFSVIKNLKDIRVILDRVLMAVRWDESLKYAWSARGQLRPRSY